MTVATLCPHSAGLDDLVANRLSQERARELNAHLESCPNCRDRFARLTQLAHDSNTLVGPRNPSQVALAPPRAPGELGWLGEYRILGILGEGGMAMVYDAEEPKLGRCVALKVLKADSADHQARERFLREARVVASLSSDRVVHVYAVGEANGVPFLAMEKLRGETLARRLERDRWLPVADALGVAREAAEGLVALHERGLIHRDIKPDNLWLEGNADGHVKRVKLIDFGIARQAVGDPSLTNPGQLIGTPLYMAPEQASGEPLDARADLYSLGCVLYRMVAGSAPFDAATPNTLAVLSAVIRSEMVPIRQAVPSLSLAVCEVIEQLLQRDPAQRPASAALLAERLRHLEHEERASTSKTKTIAAVAADSKRRTPRRAQPWSIALGVLAIVASLVVGVLVLSDKLGSMLFRPEKPTPEPSAKDAPTPVTPGGDPTRPPIKVGILFSQTDATAVHELPLIDAVQLAIEEINEAGGVLGRKVVGVVEDGASNDQQFVRKASKLIDEDDVAAIFGCWRSPARKLVAEVCADAKRDRLLFYPANDEGTEEYESVVYLGGTPNQLLVPLVKYAYADLLKRRVFVVGSETVYSHVVAAVLNHEVTQLGAQMAGTAYLTPGAAEVKPVVDQIKETKADFLVSTLSGSDNVVLFRALRAARLAPPLVTTAWLRVAEAELPHFGATVAGDYSAGCYFESLDTPANAAFLKRFRKRFGAARRVNDATVAAYSGVHLWKKAVEKCDSTRTWDVRVALRGLTLESPAGTLKIDPLTLHAWQTGRVGKVADDEGRLTFQIVHQTSGPVEPVLYPSWRSRPQWHEFLEKLRRDWGGNWEKTP